MFFFFGIRFSLSVKILLVSHWQGPHKNDPGRLGRFDLGETGWSPDPKRRVFFGIHWILGVFQVGPTPEPRGLSSHPSILQYFRRISIGFPAPHLGHSVADHRPVLFPAFGRRFVDLHLFRCWFQHMFHGDIWDDYPILGFYGMIIELICQVYHIYNSGVIYTMSNISHSEVDSTTSHTYSRAHHEVKAVLQTHCRPLHSTGCGFHQNRHWRTNHPDFDQI